MKCGQLARSIDAFAQSFRQVGGEASSLRLRKLVGVLRKRPSAVFRRFAASARDATRGEASGDLEALRSDLEAIARISQQVGTKALRAAINDLTIMLSDHGNMNLDAFLTQLSESIQTARDAWELPLLPGEARNDCYARVLNDAVHDAALFPRIFAALETDRDVKKADIIAIANKFTFKMPANVTKEQALKYIWGRHQVSEDTARHIKAIGGKSAA